MIITIVCKKCRKWKDISCFLEREDRAGFYQFCLDCMDEQMRFPDYPSEDERGGGSLGLIPRG